jgi:hypothetical protein
MTAQGLSFQGLQKSEGSVIQSDLGPTLAATDTTLPISNMEREFSL